MITIEDFMSVELVTAKVKEAQHHPDADKLMVLKIEIGDEERQIVAGVRKSYEPEELVGKTIVVVKNLQPVVLRGVESQGMLLAASTDEGPVVLTTDRNVDSGIRIK